MKQQVTAKLRNLRIASRKLRLVANVIRGKDALTARSQLAFLRKKGAKPFLKLLESALANARNQLMEEKDLFLAKVLVDEGSKLKRWRPRARGQAYQIQKKTSHLSIVLEQKTNTAKKKKKQPKPASQLVKRVDNKAKTKKPKMKPEAETLKPKQTIGSKRIFRRKSF